MILEQTTDLANKIRIVWQQPSGKVYMFKFDQEPTLQQLGELGDHREQLEQDQQEQPILQADESKESIISLVELFKSRPSINLTQFNNYLNTLLWYQQYELKYVLYLIGSKLSQRNEITLNSLTELQFLQKVRDFIANTPIKRLYKIFLNVSH